MARIDCDLLVIGAGGAGAMAAFTAAKKGVKVAVVSKGRMERSGSTIMAPGAISAVDARWASPGDSRQIYFEDTIKGGSFINDQDKVQIMVEETPELVLELERIGALWQRNEQGDSFLLRIDGGHSYPRCVYLEDRTGREMLRALGGELTKRDVPLYEEMMVLRLLKDKNGICGAAALDLKSSELVLFSCKAVILAAGGAGNLYLNTSNPVDVTGDGYYLGLKAGAELMDMEFVQFYPIGFLFPPSLRGVLAGIHSYSRFRNSLGERFMEKYDPARLELSTRDLIARSMFREIASGRGSPLGGVYLDLTFHAKDYLSQVTPALCETYEKIGLDPSREYLEIAPTCHFFMGGLVVNNDWETCVPGLLAAGECAAGMHGANRLAQNALAELLVSGRRAALRAVEIIMSREKPALDPAELKKEKEKIRELCAQKTSGGTRPVLFRKKLQTLMWEKVGVFRTGEGLQEAKEKLIQYRCEMKSAFMQKGSRALFNRSLWETLENEFLLEVGLYVTRSALARRESRGSHYRDDFPATCRLNGLKHVVLKGIEDTLEISRRPIVMSMLPAEGEKSHE